MTSDFEPISLTGSSAPTGIAPDFAPIAHQPSPMTTWPNQLVRTPEQRLVDLNQEYERALDFHDAADAAQDAAESESEAKRVAANAMAHAERIMAEIRDAAYLIPAGTIREAALKARIMSHDKAFFWDTGVSEQDADVRVLIEDVLALGGLDRLRRRDTAFAAILPGYSGPERQPAVTGVAPTATQPCVKWSDASTIENLARKFAQLDCRKIALQRDEDADVGVLDNLKREAQARALSIEMDHLRFAASYMEIQTPLDAMFCVIQAWSDMDVMASCYVAQDVPDELHNRASRCLFSVLRYLERQTGVSGKELGSGNLMPDRLDPFLVGDEDAPFDGQPGQQVAA